LLVISSDVVNPIAEYPSFDWPLHEELLCFIKFGDVLHLGNMQLAQKIVYIKLQEARTRYAKGCKLTYTDKRQLHKL
jgi:hypothetical protein